MALSLHDMDRFRYGPRTLDAKGDIQSEESDDDQRKKAEDRMDDLEAVSYTHLTLPTNREV